MLAVAIIPYTEQEFMNEDGIDSELKLEQIQAISGEAEIVILCWQLQSFLT